MMKRVDRAIRPKLLAEYVGQPGLLKMEIFIEAARQRGMPLDHLLIFVPGGSGKPHWRILSPMEMGR